MKRISNPDAHALCLVQERGARWPAWLAACRRGVPAALIEAQSAGEPPLEFEHRVRHKLQLLTASGASIRTAVLSVVGDSDAERRKIRLRLARKLIECMDRAPSATLVLAAPRGISRDARHELLSLAGALLEHASGHKLSIRVSIEPPRIRKCAARTTDTLNRTRTRGVSAPGQQPLLEEGQFPQAAS